MGSGNVSPREWNLCAKYFDEDFVVEFDSLANEMFNARAGFYHYHSLAKGNYNRYLQGVSAPPKKIVNVMHALMSAEYVRKFSAPPPINYGQLCMFSEVGSIARTALEAKRDKLIAGHVVNPAIREHIDRLDTMGASLNRPHINFDDLNAMFMRWVLK